MTDDQYYIPASDTKGHSSMLSFRVMPMVLTQLDEIVSSKKVPYKTKTALLRHALTRHIKYLEAQTGHIATLSGQVDIIYAVLEENKRNMDFKEVFDQMGTQVSSFLATGSNGEAVRVIRNIQELMTKMPDGYWRDYYLHTLDARFGDLLKKNDKANLLKTED